MTDKNLIDLANQTQGALAESRITSLVSDLAAKATQSGVQQGSYDYAADTGAANAYVVTLAPVPTLAAGLGFSFKAAHSNSGASTINPNSLGATTIKKWSSGSLVDLASGDITAGQIIPVIFDGTYFQIVGGSGGGGGGGGSTAVYGEVASGTVNGSNVTFTLAHTPIAGTVRVYWEDGRRLRSGAGNDYTISGGTITLANAPANGAPLADYSY